MKDRQNVSSEQEERVNMWMYLWKFTLNVVHEVMEVLYFLLSMCEGMCARAWCVCMKCDRSYCTGIRSSTDLYFFSVVI